MASSICTGCERRMKLAPAFFLIILVALECVVCLPPDFFRNGRTEPVPPSKRTSTELQLIYKACRFCSFFSPAFGLDCRRNLNGSRKLCIRAYGFYVQNSIQQSRSRW
ncbi:hypothetical protein LSAT2_024754 [Lamellibrachia satsuma]|nr:hypothetical protein LSAT2_024754 [Lamellibrachia satsuma]